MINKIYHYFSFIYYCSFCRSGFGCTKNLCIFSCVSVVAVVIVIVVAASAASAAVVIIVAAVASSSSIAPTS